MLERMAQPEFAPCELTSRICIRRFGRRGFNGANKNTEHMSSIWSGDPDLQSLCQTV